MNIWKKYASFQFIIILLTHTLLFSLSFILSMYSMDLLQNSFESMTNLNGSTINVHIRYHLNIRFST